MTYPLDLDGISIVMLGSVNPAIFHPDWFLRQDLITEDDHADSKTELVSEEVSVVSLGRMRLTIQPKRFQVETKSLDLLATVRDLVLGTFRILEHTPVESMGINRHMHFKMPSEAVWHRVGHQLVPKEAWTPLLDEPGTLTVQVQGRRPDSPAKSLRVQVAPSAKVANGIYIGTNEHYVAASEPRMDTLLGWLQSEWEPAQVFAHELATKLLAECTRER